MISENQNKPLDNTLSENQNKPLLDNRRLVKTKRKHCQIIRRFEVDTVPGTTKSAVVFNSILDQ
jgi:hypothetical protein